MRVLFLTMSRIGDPGEHDIYQDLCRCFAGHGHEVYIMTPAVPGTAEPVLLEYGAIRVLQVPTDVRSGGSLIRKGISTVMLPWKYIAAANKFLERLSFDLILYSTPPITLLPVVEKLKKKNRCATYLMLKDIFPQNAVDLGMFSGRSPVYHWFRLQEKRLYRVSDTIGCMSPANIAYLKAHNDLGDKPVELCPNALEIGDVPMLSRAQKAQLRREHGIPEDAMVFVYGGNLGAPQGVEHICKCLERFREDPRVYFLIIGSGTGYGKLNENIQRNQYPNVRLLESLPRGEYYRMMRLADVGMVFLDHRFTIPNFPSRILPYMEHFMPIACVTDEATDVGTIAEDNGFGWWCASGDAADFENMIEEVLVSDTAAAGRNARAYLERHYHVDRCYQTIVEKVAGGKCHG